MEGEGLTSLSTTRGGVLLTERKGMCRDPQVGRKLWRDQSRLGKLRQEVRVLW